MYCVKLRVTPFLILADVCVRLKLIVAGVVVPGSSVFVPASFSQITYLEKWLVVNVTVPS